MTLFIFILLFFAVGLLWQKLFSPPDKVADYLNWLVINIALPAIILLVIPEMEINSSIAIPFISYWSIVLLAWIVTRYLAKQLTWSKDISCAVFVLSICGNTAFLGVPMAKALLGDEAVGYALIYDQLGCFLGLSIVVTITIASYQAKQTTSNSALTFSYLLYKVISFAPFTVLVIALLFPIQALLAPFEKYLSWLGKLIIPITMVVIGLKFSLSLEKKYLMPLTVLLLLKMLIYPLLIWGTLSVLNDSEIIIAATVFQSAAAPMVTAAALLISARIAVPLVTSALGIGTCVSFFLLPLWATLLI